ncbi:MAG: hypothetical protein WDO24_14415 [Pseudomonadota bacterium]
MVRIPKRIPQRGADPQADLGMALAARYPTWFALGRVASLPGWTALIEQLFADLDRTLTKPRARNSRSPRCASAMEGCRSRPMSRCRRRGR